MSDQQHTPYAHLTWVKCAIIMRSNIALCFTQLAWGGTWMSTPLGWQAPNKIDQVQKRI